jgi:hypothetical protein
MKQPSRSLWRNLGLGVFAIGVALGTLYIFPVLGYVSIAGYGFPASLLVLGGYVTWLILQRLNKSVAAAFAVAFASPILFMLIVLLFIALQLPIMIIAPTFCLWLVQTFLARHRRQARQDSTSSVS